MLCRITRHASPPLFPPTSRVPFVVTGLPSLRRCTELPTEPLQQRLLHRRQFVSIWLAQLRYGTQMKNVDRRRKYYQQLFIFLIKITSNFHNCTTVDQS